MKKAPMPLNEDERLGSLLNFRVLDTESEVEYDRITRLAATICKTNISLISLVDSNRQWFKSSFGLAAEETPRDISFCGHAIMSDEVFIVEDSSKDDRFKDNPLCVDAPNVVFYAGMTLVTKSGDRIGTLCVIHDEPKSLNQEQKDCLKDLSLQVMKLFELKLVEKKFNEISNAASIGHWSFNLSSQKITWSDKMYELFNYDKNKDAPSFDLYKSLIHQEDFEHIQKAIFNSIETKLPHTLIHRVITESGEPKWLESHGEPILNTRGDIIGLNGVSLDISQKMLKNLELEKYQSDLKDSNTYLSFAMEGAGLGIWDWYLDDSSVRFNEGWA